MNDTEGEWVAAAYAAKQPRGNILWENIVALMMLEIEHFLSHN